MLPENLEIHDDKRLARGHVSWPVPVTSLQHQLEVNDVLCKQMRKI